MNIIAVDPGNTAGMALWAPKAPLLLHETSDPLSVLEYAQAGDPLVRYRPDTLVIEQWDSRRYMTRNATARQIQAVMRWAGENSVTVSAQQVSAAKAFSTDWKLKALRWHDPKTPHANDATRHLLYFLVLNDLLPPEMWEAITPKETE